ncbi:hypothetical protein [Tenacibaculum larymnensis]|uniref:AbiTii domain-containing protein n=1 Tax=Tenacibaculum larymnensis TaxID=2878201 RepID=A0A9X4EVV4_9FLAO|nr:hypothetical protein [Tenacibaculum larymnensis]MDE1207301.1 hypothetical protein [Tenacibaculum larymnensis]
MIKELIKDLTYDEISLSQGLTRAKLIAYKINNDDFKHWITTELNGYTNDDKLPDYRIIPCEIFAVLEGYGARKMVPYDLTNLDKDLNGQIYKMQAKQSVPTIEEGLSNSSEQQYGYEDLPMQLVNMLREMSDNKFIVSVKRRIQLSQASHILNLTKQKLIDTLLELDSAFPNLQDDYQNTTENNEKASTIINNHIYGDNSSSNIGVGENITQKVENVYHQKIENILSDLKDLGVPEEDLLEVKEIVTKETDKVSLGKKLVGWVGKMTNKALEKGIELQVPMIMEKIQELM